MATAKSKAKPKKAVEGADVRPNPPPTVKPEEVTKDELKTVEGCSSCEITFDVNDKSEILRAMVIGDALNTPRFRYPYGKKR